MQNIALKKVTVVDIANDNQMLALITIKLMLIRKN